MADKDIKQRIVLEGEKEYSNALKEAQRNLKVLRSELKAESAELGKNATEQQKNEAKIKNLNKQIKEQEKIVKTYEQALQEVREKYGDNEEAIAKWEIKLNDARAALANMKNGLNDVGNGLKQTNADLNTGVTAANSLADSFSKISDIGSNVSTALEGIFSSMISTISDTVSAIWTQLTEIAAKADKYSDTADFLGSTPAEVQKWANAMESAGGSLDTVVNLMTRLKYGGKEKNVTEWFGISAVNYENDLQYFEAVMSKMAESKDAMKSAGTWATAMSDIFGAKKVQDVDSILSDWPEILAGLAKYDAENGGFGLSDEQIEKMNTLYNQVENLKTSWNALKGMATVELLGNLALNITGNLQNIVDAFKEYFDAEDDAGRQAAIEKIKANIIEIFDQIKDAIEKGIELINELAENLKNSDDSVLQILGNLLSTIVGGLEWFMNPDNWETVKKGFEAIIGVWATGKILSALGNMATFGAHLATIGKFFGAGNGAANVAADAAGTVVTSGGGSALGELVTGLSGIAGVAAIVEGFKWAANRRINNPEDVRGTDQNLAANTGGDEALKNAFVDYVTVNRDLQSMMDQGIFDDNQLNEMLDKLDAVTETLNAIEGAQDLLKAYSDWRQEHSYGNMDWELPADWWTNGGKNEGLTSDDVSSFRTLPNNISAAVRNGVGNIRVTMDGQTVGRLVAPYVSEMIARDMVV